MLKNKPTLFSSVFLIFAMIACALPAAQSPDALNLALTITAQASLLQPSAAVVNVAETATTAPTSTPEFTPTITLTPTPSVPTVTVSVDTNCRTGPGLPYDRVGALLINQSAEVVGKNTPTNSWIIKTPGGVGNCWLWGNYATVSGNTANLPEFQIPATPTPSPTPTPASPAPVKNLAATKICAPVIGGFQFGGTLNWEDKSNNELGFNIYLNGAIHGVVGENVITYPIPAIIAPGGTVLIFSVESYNTAGASIQKSINVVCP